MWEEFTQSIHTFIEDKKNLAQHTQGKKKATLILIPSVSAKGTKWEVFGMPILNDLITNDIRGEQYYNAYLEKVAKHQRYLAGEEVSDPDSPAPKPAKATKPKASKKSKPLAPKATTKKPKPALAKPQEKKRKLVTETSEVPSLAKRSKAGVLENEPRIGDEEADLQKAVEESLKEFHSARQGPLPPVVIKEPESRKFQPLPEVQGKGQAGPNPSEHDEGQAGPNPGDSEASQPPSSHVVHAGPNLEHMDLEASNTSIQPNPEQMDKEFTTTAYPNVQENLKLPTEGEIRLEEPARSARTLSSLQNLDKELSFADQFLVDKSQEDELEKTNTESEVQSMVTIPIHQDTSSVPLMITPVIDLIVSQPVSTTVQAPLPTSTATVTAITTITSLLPPLTQPQQGPSDSILIQLYKLENLDIPHQVSKAVDEIVTDAVNWAIQAPLRDRFRDLPEADIKEILHHRMWETKSYKAHEDHKKLTKKEENETRVTKNTTWVSTSSATPPPPPSGPFGTSVASGSSQLPPPPPPPSTNQSDQSKSTAAPSSSKTAALAEYTA
ncbi:E-beta-farnesene synthase [Tanacetum coccineum]